jgi:hypothetical protein
MLRQVLSRAQIEDNIRGHVSLDICFETGPRRFLIMPIWEVQAWLIPTGGDFAAELVEKIQDEVDLVDRFGLAGDGIL